MFHRGKERRKTNAQFKKKTANLRFQISGKSIQYLFGFIRKLENWGSKIEREFAFIRIPTNPRFKHFFPSRGAFWHERRE